MNSVQLKSFIAVAETLNFHKASELVGCSQASVSKHIALLEEELREELFIRSTRRVSLTKYGEAFLVEAQALVDRIDHIAERVRQRLDAEDNASQAASDGVNRVDDTTGSWEQKEYGEVPPELLLSEALGERRSDASS